MQFAMSDSLTTFAVHLGHLVVCPSSAKGPSFQPRTSDQQVGAGIGGEVGISDPMFQSGVSP